MATATPDTAVATAMNTVLEAEREVALAVAHAQAESAARIDAAREARRNILERSRQRVGVVRQIAQRQLASQLLQLDAAVAVDSSDGGAMERAAGAAIARLARTLTSGGRP